MGNTVPPGASGEATGSGRRGARTGRGRSENVVAEAAPPAMTTSRVVATARRKQGRDDDSDGDVEEETAHAGRALRAGGAGGAAPAAPVAGKVLTVKIVVRRKDAEALVARLEARERKARMAELRGELRRAGSCCCSGGEASQDRDARRPMLPPIQEHSLERTQVVHVTPLA